MCKKTHWWLFSTKHLLVELLRVTENDTLPFQGVYAYIHSMYARLQDGGAGENTAEFESICVHVVVAPPINSKPGLQL